MKEYFNENDSTLYKLGELPFGNYVAVEATAVPELRAAYDKIKVSLQRYFQPVRFALDEGVFVGSSPDSMFPIKTIFETNNSIRIAVFGSDQEFSFPTPAEEDIRPVRVPLLTAVPMQNQQYTSIFNTACNYALSGAYRVSAWIANDSAYLSVDGPGGFTVPGKLTCLTQDFFESQHLGIRRVWSFSDHKFNSLMAGLPRTIDVFLDSGNRMCIYGLPLAGEKQTLVCRTCVALNDELCLTCVTLQNDIPFDVRLTFDGNSINGQVAGSYEFNIKNNFGGIYNENN